MAICWWMIGRLRVSAVVRSATTMFFAFGTVFWYTAQNTTTWYQAHIVAVGLTMLAVGLALGADRGTRVRDAATTAPLARARRHRAGRGHLIGATASVWRRPPA